MKTKKMIFAMICAALVFIFSGCSEAEKVNANISKQADYFGCLRRVTVWNTRTDNIVFFLEGYISISNNSTSEIVITAKVGENQYKKNYIYLNDWTLYVVEDISGTYTDPYHYHVYFHTDILPEIDVKP